MSAAELRAETRRAILNYAGCGPDWHADPTIAAAGAIETAIDAELAAARAQWQPIETAPRGMVLLYYPAKQNDRYGHGELNEMWRVDYGIQPTPRKPTHWMPLPEPPK